MRVLVIEDESTLRMVMEKFLAKEGHEMCWAATGAAAIRMFDTETLDCIILDIGLPDISGIEVARRKLSHPKVKNVPLIILTGMDPGSVRTQAREDVLTGSLLLMTKPFEVDVLRRALSLLKETR